MNKLREIRQASGLTQEKVAEMLKTTQQTVARWEAGKAEPSISALRDLSVIFGTSIDDLLGRNPFSQKAVTNRYSLLGGGDTGFWGHVGIQLPGDRMSRWYPVTMEEANRISNSMSNRAIEHPWLSVTTLNNRALLVNGLAVKHIYLLDDNADEVGGDWELGWDSYNGYPLEVYRVLADWFDFPPEECSEAFKATIEDVISEHALDVDKVRELIIETKVHYRDGTTRGMRVDDEKLWEAVSGIDYEPPLCFDLSDPDSGRDAYVPSASVYMIDMPLYQVIDAEKEELEQTEAEAQGR